MSEPVDTDIKRVFKVGLIADTHGRLDNAVVGAFAGTDLIIHAGDIGKPEILEELGQISPVIAVRGNMDAGSWAAKLSSFELIQVGNSWVYVLHDLGHLNLNPAAAGINAVVSGHIHKPALKNHNDVLYINPGSASQPRHHQSATVALLFIYPQTLSVQFVELG